MFASSFLKCILFSHLGLPKSRCCWIICASGCSASKNKNPFHVLYLSVDARLGCGRCLFIGRRWFNGSSPCLTRVADSEHILIYRAGPPGAPRTGLNTAASRCSETFPAQLSPSKWIFSPAFGILGSSEVILCWKASSFGWIRTCWPANWLNLRCHDVICLKNRESFQLWAGATFFIPT